MAASTARASEPALVLGGSSQCPSRELVESQLAPLVADRALDLDTSAPVEITDAGDSYRIRVGRAVREITDARRDCQERAKVSAVFIAMNWPERAATTNQPPPAAERAPSEPSAVLPRVSSPPPRLSVALQLLAAAEHAPALARTGKGVYVGASGRSGSFRLTLSSGLLAPLALTADGSDAATYELWRFPSSLTAGVESRNDVLSVGLEAGLALDALHFRGLEVPNPDAELRLNPGIVAAAPLRLLAGHGVAAVLVPTASYFPRTYLVRLEPTRQLGESPRWWLGVRIGLELTAFGE